MATAKDIKGGLEKTEQFLEKIATTLDDKYQPIKKALDKAEAGLDQLGESSDANSISAVLENALDENLGNANYDYVVGDTLNFNLPLITDFNDGGGLPTISSNFNLSLSLTNPTVLPSIAFKNVQLDLGSFFGDFLDPVVGTVAKVIEPFNDIFKIITDPIPGFDKIGIDINLLDLAEQLGSVDGELIKEIADFSQVVTTVNQAKQASQGLSIPLGEFTLDANGKVVNPLVTGKPSELIPSGITLPKGGFTFEALEDANNLFNLLAGEKSTNLLKFQLPGFKAEFNKRKDFPPFVIVVVPVVPFIEGRATLLSSGLTFGYDASGLGNNAPLSGFYVDGSKPLFEVDAKITGGAEANVLVAKAGGEIFIKGEADFYLPEKDPKVRFSELENLLNNFSFDAQGKVYAGASIFVEYVTYKPAKLVKSLVSLVTTGKAEEIYERKEQVIATFDLFKFGEGSGGSGGSGTQPVQPNLATFNQANGELILNIGTLASQRNISKEEINETFNVTPNVVVSAFGYQESFSNVTKIIADAGEGDDIISLVSTANDKSSVDVSVAAELRGGKGNDTLVGGSRNDTLFGGEGADLLDGRGGDDIISGDTENDRIYGGSDNDTLYGNQGNDLIDGGDNNDTLYGNENDDRLQGGEGNDILYGGDNNDALFGQEGSDTLYGDDPSNLLIGGSDFLIGGAGDDYLDAGIDNDVLAGEEGRDTLFGNSGNDGLDGGEGDDILKGGEGNDILIGGLRILSESVLDASGRQVFDENKNPVFTEPEILDDSGEDTLEGDVGNDTLTAGAGDDILDGGADNDLLLGEAGNDLINGGSDIDTVSYDNSPNGVIVNIDETNSYQNSSSGTFHRTRVSSIPIPTNSEPNFTIAPGTALDGFGTTDTLRNLENILGSGQDDVLIGNGLNNQIEGLGGNDLLVGNAGSDILDGGDGSDSISWEQRESRAVTVDLTAGTAVDGFGNTDTLRSIENVTGTAANDTIIGNAAANIIFAGAGKDTVSGRAGDDILFGEDGNDTLNGDEGNDFLVGGRSEGWNADILNGGAGNDTASYFTSQAGVNASLFDGSGRAGDAQGDRFNSIENLEGSNFNDIFVGNDGSNILIGLQGNDDLDGRAGNDTLYGDRGDDILKGGLGNDILDGGEGNDNLAGDLGNDTLDGGEGNNRLDAGEGNNIIRTGNGNNTIFAAAGNDAITAGNGSNVIRANDGENAIAIGNGNNLIYSGASADVINTGNGNNQVYAGAGNNTVTTGSGDDIIYTGAGNDAIAAGGGFNILWLGGGIDTITLELGGLSEINNFSVTQTKIDLAKVGGSGGVALAASGIDTLVVSSNSSVLGTLKFASIDTVAANSVSIFGSGLSTLIA